jgi:hypothetical protein
VEEVFFPCPDSEDVKVFQVQHQLGIYFYLGKGCEQHDER